MSINKTVVALLMSATILSACSTTEEKKSSMVDGDMSDGTVDSSTQGYSEGSGVSGESMGFNNDPRFSDPANPLSKQTVYFMYDSSQVQQDFIHVIAAHSEYLASHPAQKIILEGHADERGSREYNIALGEQRSKSVLKMMTVQGVSNSQAELVSYGEEKPASDGGNEASWHLNRRVEIVYQGR